MDMSNGALALDISNSAAMTQAMAAALAAAAAAAAGGNPISTSSMVPPLMMGAPPSPSSLPTVFPAVADPVYVQQGFTAGAPPSLVIPPTMIPLYPGYAQVPAGPGYIGSNSGNSTSFKVTDPNGTGANPAGTKYQQLLSVIEEMSHDLRPTYSGSKTSSERFKRGIAQARILLRECEAEAQAANAAHNSSSSNSNSNSNHTTSNRITNNITSSSNNSNTSSSNNNSNSNSNNNNMSNHH